MRERAVSRRFCSSSINGGEIANGVLCGASDKAILPTLEFSGQELITGNSLAVDKVDAVALGGNCVAELDAGHILAGFEG